MGDQPSSTLPQKGLTHRLGLKLVCSRPSSVPKPSVGIWWKRTQTTELRSTHEVPSLLFWSRRSSVFPFFNGSSLWGTPTRTPEAPIPETQIYTKNTRLRGFNNYFSPIIIIEESRHGSTYFTTGDFLSRWGREWGCRSHYRHRRYSL